MIVFVTSKPRLEKHFRKDPVLFSYHLGDLDDFYYSYCQWAAYYRPDSFRVDEVIMTYTGGSIPTVHAFGVGDRFRALLRESLDLLPPKFYCHYQAEYQEILSTVFDEQPLGAHFKMKFNPEKGTVKAERDSEVLALDQTSREELMELYNRSYPGHYFTERMLDTGKYYGFRNDGRLVAVAGVHVHSIKYRVAVLGNIVTHPDFRGKNLATRVTSHLVRDLLDDKLMICLNVNQENRPAIKCYQKLGFETVHRYQEALFARKH